MTQDMTQNMTQEELDNIDRLRRNARKAAVQNKIVRITIPTWLMNSVDKELLKADPADNLTIRKVLNDYTPEALMCFYEKYNRFNNYSGIKVKRSITLDEEVKSLLTVACTRLQVKGNTLPKQYTQLCNDILQWWVNKNTKQTKQNKEL